MITLIPRETAPPELRKVKGEHSALGAFHSPRGRAVPKHPVWNDSCLNKVGEALSFFHMRPGMVYP